MLSKIYLGGASMLALALGCASAQAATPTIVYGGTGTSAAKVYRDVFNCYTALADSIFATTPGNPTTIAYPTTLAPGCTKEGTVAAVIASEPVGAIAINAFTEANPAAFGSPATTNTVAYLDSTFGIASTPYPEIQFAGADVYLTTTQATQAATAAGEPIFQLPAIVEPTTLPVGQVQNVKLTVSDVCSLFSSSTNTSSGKVVFSELVVRSDSAGASYIFADWLAQNCPASLGFNAGNGFPSTLPNWTAVAAANGNHLSIVAVKGAGGIASTVASTPKAIGYVTPDYVYPVVSGSTAYPAYVNGYLPTVTNAKNRLANVTYPKTYNAATIGQQINDQLVAPGGKGYPILGFNFFNVYQCYSATFAGGLIGGPAQGKALLGLLKDFYTNSTSFNAIVNGQGFVGAPSQVTNLLKGAGGPFNATGGVQNAKCPTK